ncbi:AAA family ATPase [Lacrimispora sphenoides]|uniref:AAA domain-containing protein n=1 Tax=Lacrimispora sphenoides JCM 1415 TaxID=1297793 RepID=A0ABY1C6F7_9FIRM|nr:AAA family ATPase [Lacrimispora sphenoides]SET73777.1 AAA domain-containing protein [[Clostridium] sphenoides JCM 1415]SUY50880.1 Uncharacterized protein conserved in bacteria [Lacrimispora sphenoides]
MKLTFSKIHRESIFNADFDNLKEDSGTIEFKIKNTSGGIAVVYAPNGTGKSSFTEVLKSEESTAAVDFLATDDCGAVIDPSSKVFHIVADQISRHIILGDESQYLVGTDIRREYELKKKISDGFDSVFKVSLPGIYKSKYGVTKISDYLLGSVQAINETGYSFIKSIVNMRYRGKDINHEDFISYIKNLANREEPLELDEEKTKFVIQDCSKVKVVQRLLEVDANTIILSSEAPLIEQHSDAIKILDKYHMLHSCVVCDNEAFDGDVLLSQKKNRQRLIYDSLDQKTKNLLDKVAMDLSLVNNDPFNIKQIVLTFISGGDLDELIQLQRILTTYVNNIASAMIFDLVKCFDSTTMVRDFDELSRLRNVQPSLDSDDLLYIQDVISENIDRDIRVIRDNDNEKNFKLMLGDAPLLNVERHEMCLSTGEQNFISLTFELLLAKNSGKEYIVLDDPISSFDSIYKNKIAFCIVKFLESKKQIILTHNLELIRLLEFQLKGCFNLYMLNNMDGARNGFIRVKEEEQKLLIDLSELISFFQNNDGSLINAIKDRRQYLISMIPFMRGYAHISLDPNDFYGRLSEVMHGYGTANVDLVPIYKELFGWDFGGTEEVLASDILSLDCSNLDFFDTVQYPLLADALRQSLVYYYLRMTVERKLIDIFNINIRPGKILMLTDIIQKAFRCNVGDPEFETKRADRVFFASRKTLLNEFNHFEGNINIFQPAIDITSSRLQKEIIDIKNRLSEIETRYSA